ncbi:MAG: hypothetical protein C0171_06075, partial [Caldisphaera sp.]
MDTNNADLLYRIDSLRQRPYPLGVVILLAMTFFLVFWDVYNIGFILPVAGKQLGVLPSNLLYAMPATIGLIGYIAGEFILGYYSQKLGRRNGLMITLIIASIGSILMAFSMNFIELSIFRFIVGMAIGGEIAITPTFVAEITPSAIRGQVTGLTTAIGMLEFPIVALGAYLIIPTFTWGWRFMLGFGAIVGIIVLILRYYYLPESPRWLLQNGKKDLALKEITNMEEYIKKKYGKIERLETNIVPEIIEEKKYKISEILKNKIIAKRLTLMGIVWFIYYITDYALVLLAPTLLILKGYSIAGTFFYLMIMAIGDPVGSYLGMTLSDKFERKYIGLGTMIASFIAIIAWGYSNSSIMLMLSGFFAIMTQGLWLPVIYAYNSEIF